MLLCIFRIYIYYDEYSIISEYHSIVFTINCSYDVFSLLTVLQISFLQCSISRTEQNRTKHKKSSFLNNYVYNTISAMGNSCDFFPKAHDS